MQILYSSILSPNSLNLPYFIVKLRYIGKTLLLFENEILSRDFCQVHFRQNKMSLPWPISIILSIYTPHKIR